MKIQLKLTILFTIFFTAVFLMAAFVTSTHIDTSNRMLTKNLSTQLIESKANEAGAWLTQRIRELHTISKTPTVVSMEEDALKSYINQLSNDMNSYYGNEYGTFSINKLDGLEYITEDQTIDVSDRDYFKEALTSNDEYIISKPIISKTDQSLITVACYPIYDDADKKIGFVAASISLKKLTELTENLSFYDGKSFIVDSDGLIYTHTDEKLSDTLLQRITMNIPEKSNRTLEYKKMSEYGEDFVVFYAYIPNSPDWYLCTIIHEAELYKETRLLNTSLIGIWILLLFAGIIAIYLASHMVTKRITLLSGAMEGVRKGNLETTITVKGNDELSSLANDFNGMVVDIKELMNQVYQNQKEKRQRELEVLQSQINPHFLYNTLDTLQWKALEYNADDLSDLIVSLSSFFRISLSKGKEFISLDKELDHVKNYLAIQQFRYSDILDSQIYCDPKLYSCYLPKVLIQPLVENAIYHGIKPKLDKGNITIEIFAKEDVLNIIVTDNGVGIPKEKLEQIRTNLKAHVTSNHYGLYNVSQRIYLHYGMDYELNIHSSENVGTKVVIQLPIIMEDNLYV